jgi:hypothetical protein
MREIKMEIAAEEIEPSDVSQLEHQLGISFPEDYKQFLIRYNGGRPDEGVFHISEEEGDSSFGFLYSVHRNSCRVNEIIHNVKNYKNRIPNTMIPIGGDSFGNQILLGVFGEDRNKIYFWDHEKEGIDGPEDIRDPLTKLADSFEDFINGLKAE